MKSGRWIVATVLLAICAPARAGVVPKGVIVGGEGFATLLVAPPSPVEIAPRPRSDVAPAPDDERRHNPDEAARRDAERLNDRLSAAEPDNYIGMRIVRDPAPRYAFQFRRDAAATLARYTRDPRFTVGEGGLPASVLQPIFDTWWPKLVADRLVGGGSIQAFDGVVVFDMNVDEPTFRAIARREGWVLPDRLRLNFSPPANPHSVDPALAALVRMFARSDRLPAMVNSAALSGRIILRDGCFRLSRDGADGEPLVLFGRDSELVLDGMGYLVVRNGVGRIVRIGEPAIWAGPIGVTEADAGVVALRARCGNGPVVAVGEPFSAAHFPPR